MTNKKYDVELEPHEECDDEWEEFAPEDLELVEVCEPEDEDEWADPLEGLRQEEPGQSRKSRLDEDFPDPPRRVVELGPWLDAIFEGDTLHIASPRGFLKLPFFNPDGQTDAALVERLKTYIAFS